MNITKQLVRYLSPWLTRGTMVLLAGICMPVSAQTLVWSEEFNYTAAPDDTLWSYDIGYGDSGWGNQELQYYTSDPANVWVDGSNLVITAVRSGDSFTSARIKTQDKLTFKYGTIEARIQTPDLGDGLWPAFWTLGNNHSSVGWPACGEIDIMEMGSGSAIGDGAVNSRVGSTAHWGPDWEHHYSYGRTKDMIPDIDGTFVTYRMEWSSDEIKTYINDQWIWTMDIRGISEFHEPHFFILNLAVGGQYTGIYGAGGITAPLPAEYKVDWIRIYDNGETVLGGTSTVEPPTPGTNLLENPGFESGTDNWNLNPGWTASASTAYALGGTKSLVIDSTGAAGWSSPNVSQSFAASPGDVFNLQGYMLNPVGSSITGSSFGLFKIEFRDSDGSLLVPASVETGYLQDNPGYPGAESRPLLNASSETDVWLYSEVQAEAPPSTAAVGFYLLNVNDPSHAGRMYFDDIQATLVGDPVLPFTLSASLMGSSIQISFPTQDGVSYQMVYKSSLTNASWNTIETIVGDGNTNSVVYPASAPTRFYKVLVP